MRIKFFLETIRHFTKKDRYLILSLIFLMIFGALLETTGIVLLIPVISFLVENDPTSKFFFINNFEIIKNFSKYELLYVTLSIFFIIILIKSFFMVFLSWFKQFCFNNLMQDISKRLFNYYLAIDYIKYLKSDSGTLIRNITKGSNDVVNGFISSCLNFILELFLIIFMSLILIKLDPLSFSFFTIFFGTIGYGFYHFTKTKYSTWGIENMKNASEQYKFLQYGIHGLKDIKILDKSKTFIYNYIKYLTKTNKINAKLKIFEEIPRHLLELLFVIIISFFIFYQISIRSNSISEVLVLLGIFAVISFKLVPAINKIMRIMQSLKYNYPLTKVITDELKKSGEFNKKKINKKDPILNFKKIIFNNVKFQYSEKEKAIFNNINLEIENYQKIGISGKSGSGKTTFVDLLIGLLKPTDGKIAVDKKDLLEIENNWQKIVGYVPQSVYLLNESVKKNIAFELDDEKIDSKKVKEVIKQVQLTDLVKRMEGGIDANIGDKGLNLSGGEKQRLGIARCLYKDPKVIIMDEATASLDTETESLILKEILNNLTKNLLIILISHNTTTLHNYCNRIIKISDSHVQYLDKPIR